MGLKPDAGMGLWRPFPAVVAPLATSCNVDRVADPAASAPSGRGFIELPAEPFAVIAAALVCEFA